MRRVFSELRESEDMRAVLGDAVRYVVIRW